MVVVSASTTLLLIDPTLRLPENTWVIAGLGAILTVEVTGVATATVMTTIGTGIGIETVTAIVPRAATTGIVVTEKRIGTGVIEGAPVATLQIAGGEGATLAVRLGEALGVPVNAIVVTAINPKILVVSCHRLSPYLGCKSLSFQVVKFRDPFTVLYQDFKLKLFRQLA